MSSPSKSLRILLVGAAGTLGSAVAAELSARHEIISAGRTHGDVTIDLADPVTIVRAFKQVGKIDAVVSTAGNVKFVPLAEITPAAFEQSVYGLGLSDKLLGQVNLALAAREYLRDGGSITLVTGVLSDQPIATGSSASMVNGAIEAFVRAAAVELPRGLRINVVSPGLLTESVSKYAAYFRGFEPVPAARAALAFSRSVEGLQTGQVYRVA
jgi:NAD(P)-dependent dehydrogenase (short-subunit alcohol dehydrogenase family)